MEERRTGSQRRRKGLFVLPGRSGRRIEDLEFSVLVRLAIFTFFMLVIVISAILFLG